MYTFVGRYITFLDLLRIVIYEEFTRITQN